MSEICNPKSEIENRVLMPSDRSLQCVVVTPEQAVLDEAADFVALPMYDGELGILPGRAPLIGRLGTGELRVVQNGNTKRYFIDGGFVQVRSNTVTVLTGRAIRAEDIDAAAAERELQSAQSRLSKTEAEQEIQYKNQVRARQMLKVAQKAHVED